MRTRTRVMMMARVTGLSSHSPCLRKPVALSPNGHNLKKIILNCAHMLHLDSRGIQIYPKNMITPLYPTSQLLVLGYINIRPMSTIPLFVQGDPPTLTPSFPDSAVVSPGVSFPTSATSAVGFFRYPFRIWGKNKPGWKIVRRAEATKIKVGSKTKKLDSCCMISLPHPPDISAILLHPL